MAELKLRVSLDTSYLKGQISRLPLEFAGANISIRPRFDKQTIVNEFRLLNRYIGSKKFNIIINTNLEAEIKNADRLIKALGRVQQAASGAKGGLPIGTQVLSRTKPKGGFAAAEIKALFGAAVQGGLIDDKTLATTRAQMVAALGEIGRDSIAGLLNGLKSGDADIQNAAKFLGNNLIASFKTVLGIASPSKEFKKIGESAGQGFEQGLLKSIEIAEQSATRKMQRMLDRLARMALIMSGISGPEIGRQIAQARALPSLNFGATTPRTSVGIGPSSTGRALPPGKPLAGMISGAQPPVGLLPGRPPASNVLELNNILAGAIREYFKAVAREVELQSKAIGRTPISATPLLSQSRIAGLLPGSPSDASTLELNNILAGAVREYFKSVAREIEYKSRSEGKVPLSATPLLEQSRIAGLLPGRPSAASMLEFNNILAGAIREYFKAVARDLEARGKAPLSTTPLLPSASPRNPPLLPPIGGTSGSIRISTGAYVGQPSMMRAPSIPPSIGGGGGAPPVPPRGGGGGGGIFGGMQFNVPKLPGAGLVREIGEEFGFAAKQVLLFGTAYKALAFLQSFPGQVGDAVGALQSFRNTIKEISPSAQEAADSSQFILDIVDKYNTPLQSARDGFVKLYASMQPAGFSGDEIRDLFLGISQTAATFGMSADKVDRVNYAFAQMASKGQVMSEELKGQLGDVLPGAMAIFAEAAGFKGPDAITKFSKALEDGAYKGAAMKTLLTNVGSIMRKEFGPGAEGAARTFQGVMNRMQNSAKLLYEAFEPVAVGFLNSVVMPLTSGLKTVTDGFNAFFTGVNAKTSGGFAFAQELEKLRPTFEGLRTNAIGLVQVFGEFAKVALGVGSTLLQIAGNPIVGFMAKIYAIMVPLNMALGVMRGLWALNSLQLLLFNARVAMGVPTLSAFRGMMQATGATAAVTATSIRTAGLTLRTFFASTGVGLILVGISLLIERFMSMNQTLADTRAKALGAAEAIRSMSKTEAILEGRKQGQVVADLKALQGSKDLLRKGKETVVKVPEAMAKRLEAQGIPLSRERGLLGGASVIPQNMLESYVQRHSGLQSEAKNVPKALAHAERQAQQPVDIAPITGVAGDGTAAGKGKGADKLDTYNRSTLDFIKLRLEAEKQSLDQRRQAGLLSETGYKIAVAELELESSKEEVAERLRLSRIAINQDNLSAADKALKLKDTEIIAERELSIAANKRNIAVEGARKELEGPFNDAIDSANFSIIEQQMLLENIQNGIQDLTPDQQAYLQVLRLTTGKSEDELKLLVAKSNVTRQILEQEIAIKKQVDFEQKLRGLREEIKLLLIVNDAESRLAELRNEYDGDAAKAQQIFNLEEVKRNIEATRALISDFVSSTASDYKGFLKAVISGEDAVDALKQFQAGLTDKVLTIFLDFTMAPVEKFFKESLGNLFLPKAENIPGLDVAKEVTKDPVQATNSNTNATVANTAALEKVAGVLTGTSLSPSASELGSTLSTNVTGTIENVTEQTKAEGIKFSESLGKTVGAIGIAAGSIMGIAAGIGQIKEGGTSNVLGGIGSVLMSLGGAVGGFAGFLKGANGGVAGGGWKPFPVTAFANGGMVNGPTLGLVGEGKYNEAIVPLPDGRSIPVQVKGGGGGGLREAMGQSPGRSGSPILNMSFQSTNINGVEYVSRDQLEQAMAATRRQAVSDGAKRGMSMTLDKLQQSPSTRSRLGMGGR